MQRRLTPGEREMIAGALYRRGEKLQKEADKVLACASFWNGEETGEPSDESRDKLERLAGTVVARFKGLRKQAKSYYTLGDFIANSKHDVTVDCLIIIPEQA